MTTAQTLIDQLRRELLDEGDETVVEIPDSELIDKMNLAMSDIMQRAPEANVVHEIHNIPASDPALRELPAGAVKFIKVGTNLDDRTESMDIPEFSATASTYKLAQVDQGAPAWWQDYTIYSFDLNLDDMMDDLYPAEDWPYEDALLAGIPIAQSRLYIASDLYLECEMKLTNVPAAEETIIAGFQVSETDANFNHVDTAEPLVYWSNSDTTPVNTGSPSLFVESEATINQDFSPTPDGSYTTGLKLDENWKVVATPMSIALSAAGNQVDLFHPTNQAALKHIRIITAGANFSSPNRVEIRNVRIRSNSREIATQGYPNPPRAFSDGAPFSSNFLHQYQAVAQSRAQVFLGYDAGKTFPVGNGGSAGYSGYGYGDPGGMFNGTRNGGSSSTGPGWLLSKKIQNPFSVDYGAVPPGEWEGNRCYWPSEAGIDLASLGWDGLIDNLSVSIDTIMTSDPQAGVLEQKFAVIAQFSLGDTTFTSTYDRFLGTITASEDLAQAMVNDNRSWGANDVNIKTAKAFRFKFNTFMGFPAQHASSVESDIMIANASLASSLWFGRWSATPPLTIPKVEGASGSLRYAEKDVFDTYDPDWEQNPPAVTGPSYYEHYMHDPRDPTRFYVYPAPPSDDTSITVVYSKMPTSMTDTHSVYPLTEKWEGATMAYAKYLVLTGENRKRFLPEPSRQRLLDEYTTVVAIARGAGYTDALRKDG